MQFKREEVLDEGNPMMMDTLHVDDKTIILKGRYMRIASIDREWYVDIDTPQRIIDVLAKAHPRPDIFTFWQRLPETEPKYDYYMEWENISAIPLKSYEDWWNNRISSDSRNKVRKGPKKGLDVKAVEFSDELVRGIMNVFNESPIKRGKPFRHYGKDFDTVKKLMSDSLDSSQFIGAYYENELVGFIKLNFTNRYAMISMILAMMKHLNKFTNNALIAKAVEVCEQRKIPYITYTTWRRGTHGDFQRLNGFDKIALPRYYVPLTLKGKLALKLNLHRGMKGLLPEKLTAYLLEIRRMWYEKIWINKTAMNKPNILENER